MKGLSVILMLLIFIAGCSSSSEPVFSGDWILDITGDFSSSFNFTIDPANKFDTTQSTMINGRDFDVGFEGEVAPDGFIKAAIFLNGDRVGQFKGQLNEKTGEGQWDAMGYGGTWSAVKK